MGRFSWASQVDPMLSLVSLAGDGGIRVREKRDLRLGTETGEAHRENRGRGHKRRNAGRL